MRTQDRSSLIKWVVILGDFVVLNAWIYLLAAVHPQMMRWNDAMFNMYIVICNLAMVLSEVRFYTIIHERVVSSDSILRRVVMLTVTQTVLAYVILKAMDWPQPVSAVLFLQGTALFILLMLLRFVQRTAIKRFRQRGRNQRTMTFVGSDKELLLIYDRLAKDPAMGYRALGYYADEPIKGAPQELSLLGSMDELMSRLDQPEQLQIGDELYVCLSRRDRETIRRLSRFCDMNVKRFFFVPVSVDTLKIGLRRELLGDMEVFSTHESPLMNPVNKIIKRTFDIVLSGLFLLLTGLLFPFIALIIKWQSPGPIFFRQQRTGLDGKNFWCYKFRSMHVNKDADKVQATENDPRKFAFGNLMRKTNIDELPQFLNVLKGDMSLVGPRPHMLAHTEMYRELIDKYMVRHFVKPGITGWAQVTGYRGETKELWQMEGRVERDIWYMENWSFWLDIRIIWMTAKSIIIHDKNAY